MLDGDLSLRASDRFSITLESVLGADFSAKIA